MTHNGNQLLIVDDERNVLNSLQRVLKPEGYVIHSTNSAKDGLRILKKNNIGVVLSDYMMPEIDGITFLELAGREKPDAIMILFTGQGSLDNAMTAINRLHIFAYLTKPYQPEDLKEIISKAFHYYNLEIENKKLQESIKERNQRLSFMNENLEKLVRERTLLLEESVREGIVMLAMAAEAKDDDTGGHVQRIQKLTHSICLGFGMDDEQAEQIALSSIMHDVGKIHIPDSILKKPGKLNQEEWEIMQSHCLAGERILGEKPFYKTAREIARSHHERWNGTGYPDGLKGEFIPLAARIVTVADIFDALTNKRPYKEAWPVDKAVREMETMSGSVFDPNILSIFLNERLYDLEI